MNTTKVIGNGMILGKNVREIQENEVSEILIDVINDVKVNDRVY